MGYRNFRSQISGITRVPLGVEIHTRFWYRPLKLDPVFRPLSSSHRTRLCLLIFRETTLKPFEEDGSEVRLSLGPILHPGGRKLTECRYPYSAYSTVLQQQNLRPATAIHRLPSSSFQAAAWWSHLSEVPAHEAVKWLRSYRNTNNVLRMEFQNFRAQFNGHYHMLPDQHQV